MRQVTNEQVLTAIETLHKEIGETVKDHEKRMRTVELAGVPVICKDRETRLRKVETRTLLWSGKAVVVGSMAVVFLCGMASCLGAWIVK